MKTADEIKIKLKDIAKLQLELKKMIFVLVVKSNIQAKNV